MKPAIPVLFLLITQCPLLLAQQAAHPQSQPGTAQTPTAPQTEKIEAAPSAPSATRTGPAMEGFMEPAQVKELLHRVWLAEFRINDLLTEVHPERWKLGDVARRSFQQTFDTLRSQMHSLEEWRGQLEAHPDSIYLEYMTHAAIDALLPRLDAVTRMISQRENASLGAQFSQAGNQLFDLEQAVQPYLTYLLRNQDQLLLANQTNLASCQHELSFAMSSHPQPVTPMKNVRPNFKGLRKPRPSRAAGSQPRPAAKSSAAPPAGPASKRP
jgi:hypothetical protein